MGGLFSDVAAFESQVLLVSNPSHSHVTVSVWRSMDNSWKMLLSFWHEGSRKLTPVTGLGSKHLCPESHPTSLQQASLDELRSALAPLFVFPIPPSPTS